MSAQETEVFPRLKPDTAESCPHPVSDLQRYLKLEEWGDETGPDFDLKFVRTAVAFECRYWIWEYTPDDGARCYATIEVDSKGHICLGMDWGTDDMTPEDYLMHINRRSNPTQQTRH